MLLIALRTDKPDAELALYDDMQCLVHETWLAHRHLAEMIHLKIAALLKSQGKDLADVQGIAIFKGPGSFTGLRIGVAVANALAFGLGIGLIASEGADWLEQALQKLLLGETDTIAVPEYGALARITQQKK